MNPDYFKTNEKKLYKHELDRVKSMTDRQLYTRYGKMTKSNKMQAFYEALADENRVPELRKQMGIKSGYGIGFKKKKRTIKNASNGRQRPKAVFALRSSEEHDDAGVWIKVFMLYNYNTVQITEFENGQIDNTTAYSYEDARRMWRTWTDEGMHRDDSYIKGLPLGDVRI